MNNTTKNNILSILNLQEKGCSKTWCGNCFFYHRDIYNPYCRIYKESGNLLQKLLQGTEEFDNLIQIKCEEQLNYFDPIEVFEVKLLRNS